MARFVDAESAILGSVPQRRSIDSKWIAGMVRVGQKKADQTGPQKQVVGGKLRCESSAAHHWAPVNVRRNDTGGAPLSPTTMVALLNQWF